MKVFLDANILISVLNKEYPLFTHTARILSLADKKGFEIYTSPICLAIAFYFAEKKYKSVAAKEKIRILSAHINIAEATKTSVQKTLKDKSVLDFEDGLEYYAAVENGCHCIVTEDTDDFHFSKIEVLNSEAFFEKYMMKKRK
ncbi:MAG TPA: PIN domain-containing protein [Flavisolibacter sp.]|nr:PIN domain-containing protein [Flavisolibacter sp.]